MLAEIDTEFAATRGFVARDRLDPRVTAAMAAVPRHLFVPPDLRDQAYRNRPLPIGEGQTISQPFIVALMSDLAAPLPGDRVLEVGTGCGYQTAVLAEMGAEVYSIERLPGLAAQAARNLEAAGYSDVRLRQGDGSLGWPEAAPFQAILVAAAAFKRAPPALIAQLAPGGRLVIPVAVADLPRALRFARDLPPVTSSQELRLITKDAEGRLDDRLMLPVAFVPLVEDESG
jgi:protein-L-isoaspartate(D-aspartate) O-methyltransferase